MKEELGFVAALIAQAGVDYAVIGGHAVNAWLEPRFTADIDVTIVAAPVQLEQLTEVFEKEGLSMSEQHGAELVSGPDFVRFATSDATVVVELQLAKTALQASVVSRARSREGPPRPSGPRAPAGARLVVRRAAMQRLGRARSSRAAALRQSDGLNRFRDG